VEVGIEISEVVVTVAVVGPASNPEWEPAVRVLGGATYDDRDSARTAMVHGKSVGESGMRIFGIDPGTTHGAFVEWETKTELIIDKGDLNNDDLMHRTLEFCGQHPDGDPEGVVACEFLQCQGMPVGKETFETAYWIGAVSHACIASRRNVFRVYRKDVKLHFCGTCKAKEPNIKQALIDRFGSKGTKSQPGKLFGVKDHIWSALCVAIYCGDYLTKPRTCGYTPTTPKER
jgi:hypothetical protein